VIVTGRPSMPLAGLMLLIIGVGSVKLLLLVPVPLAVVTVIGPLVTPEGTVTTICVSVILVIAPAVPLNETVAVLPKPVPVIVTVGPTSPLVGVKFDMVGAGTVKFVLLVAAPPAAVTVIGPVVTPEGTVTTICVSVLLTTLPAVPLNAAVALVPKLVPV